MSLTIPNAATASFPDQAAPDQRDFDVLVAADAEVGVLSGCAVTATGSSMVLTVASGAARFGVSTPSATVAGNTVTIGAANATNPRYDLIVVSTAGVASAIAGTAAAAPVFPAFNPATQVVLAVVWVPANATTLAAGNLVDKRVVVPALTATSVAGRTGTVTLTAADIASGTFPATGTAAYTMLGSLVMSDGGGSSGSVRHNAGYSGSSGFTAFHSSAGTRQGFIGDSNTNAATDTGTLKYTAGTHAFQGGAAGSIPMTVTQPVAGATVPVLVVKGGATPGAGGNLQDWRDSAGVTLAQVDSNGWMWAKGLPITNDSTTVPPQIQLLDAKAGQATPNKSIRSNGGALEFINSAYTATIASLSDTGTLGVQGGIALGTAAQVGPGMHSDGTNVYVETSGSATVFLRPGGGGVSTGQTAVATTGVTAPSFTATAETGNVVVSDAAAASKLNTNALASPPAGSDGDLWAPRDYPGGAVPQSVGGRVAVAPGLSTGVGASGSLTAVSCPLPVGTLQTGTLLRVRAFGRVTTGGTTGADIRAALKISGTTLADCIVPNLNISLTNRSWSVDGLFFVTLAGASGTLMGYLNLLLAVYSGSSANTGAAGSTGQVASGGAPTPLTVNTTVAQTAELIIWTSTAIASQQVFVDFAEVELVKP